MKYKLDKTDTVKTSDGKILYRIIAMESKKFASSGDRGGYVCSEKNLAQYGDAWVHGNAWVYGHARVYGNSQVSSNARVSGNAQVYGDAQVYGNAWVYGDAQVSGNARVSGNAQVYGDARVYGDDLLFVSGLRYPLTITRQNVCGGCREFTHESFCALTLDNCQDKGWTQEELDAYKSMLDFFYAMPAIKNTQKTP